MTDLGIGPAEDIKSTNGTGCTFTRSTDVDCLWQKAVAKATGSCHGTAIRGGLSTTVHSRLVDILECGRHSMSTARI